MKAMKTVRLVVAGIVAAAVAGCGADEIVSPGSGGNITINYPPGSGGDPGGDPGGDGDVQPATGCPSIANPAPLTDSGTIEGPTGEYRVCTLPARFTVDTTLNRVEGLLYALDGRVDVGNDLGPTDDPGEQGVVLTIRPGVIIYSRTGNSWLAVNRGNQLVAVGEATRPIVFTSRQNVQGTATDDSIQQWGGVVLLGRARTTDCTVAPGATPGTIDCERDTEGAAQPAIFGGATDDDSSGEMQYVQLRYSGYPLSLDSELQSLTLGSVGSGTSISHIQSHNSSDDGFEAFGGTVDLRRFVITGADDDNVDADTGYQGTIQYLIAVQRAGGGDSMIELDSGNTRETNTPRTKLKLANFTFVHTNAAAGNGSAMRFRGGADASLVNGVVTSPIAILRVDNNGDLTSPGTVDIMAANAGLDKEGPPAFNSVVFASGAASAFRNGSGVNVSAAQVEAAYNLGANNNAAFTASLTGGFINGANEAAVVATDPATIDARFDTTTYVGAVNGASDTWYAGWTCNSATANFGSTGTSCTSLPSLED
jgi:hypothetical protein